ncbi:MAG TPA: hypothetical protein VFS43_15620 [Polyangiaceae bacterium]|nr:hypothetical protein [Polyangiaceae bacterium]
MREPAADDEGQVVRVVGRRQSPAPGQPPSPVAREAMGRMARYRTRAPKGIFVSRSHEEANRDRERWLVEAMVEAASGMGRDG